MFADIIRYSAMFGLEYNAIGFVAESYDAYVLGNEPYEKLNGSCNTNVNADKSVYIACDILNSALNVDNYPGLFCERSFNTDV